ncbi:hypothetical protein MPTK1_2g17230 [Marchantia polymorpha subsp. ruderalis]|uniref:Uncharacterized protein n=1 Tax=Marchantia polymorpha TaxID=3197 RepID=A0A2R6VZC5_MARPO|nr:hypothetical protein MARPO_0254s0003 [Marchantia polymorpha]BBN02686.1 hypothetical protein Mp_2g17230 [Marchantia polymorpha subsp. ruderalis]|eukprot:PTQ26958.1 hypothetical protein MARPO_0254s0003 [Marchantia polymorpha]
MESAKNPTNTRAEGSASDLPAAVELQYPGSLYKIPGSLGDRHSIDLDSDHLQNVLASRRSVLSTMSEHRLSKGTDEPGGPRSSIEYFCEAERGPFSEACLNRDRPRVDDTRVLSRILNFACPRYSW